MYIDFKELKEHLDAGEITQGYLDDIVKKANTHDLESMIESQLPINWDLVPIKILTEMKLNLVPGPVRPRVRAEMDPNTIRWDRVWSHRRDWVIYFIGKGEVEYIQSLIKYNYFGDQEDLLWRLADSIQPQHIEEATQIFLKAGPRYRLAILSHPNLDKKYLPRILASFSQVQIYPRSRLQKVDITKELFEQLQPSAQINLLLSLSEVQMAKLSKPVVEKAIFTNMFGSRKSVAQRVQNRMKGIGWIGEENENKE